MATRFVNSGGRAGLHVGGRIIDIERASGGALPADPMAALARWDDIQALAATVSPEGDSPPYDEAALGPCVPTPRQVFGIALNYRKHAEETGAAVPPAPSVFTKFPSCIAGPFDEVPLPSDFVDWEVELVAVIGRGGRDIAEDHALDHLAGYTCGQDFSERNVQMAGSRPQFSLAKSYRAFGPIGPQVVSLDAFDDPNRVHLRCEVNDAIVQDEWTNDLIFGVAHLVAYISSICDLYPGDLIFTGTPSGVGVARKPPRFLCPGDVVTTTAEGVGTMRNRVIAG